MKTFLVLCFAVFAIAVYQVDCSYYDGGGEDETTPAPEPETTPAPETTEAPEAETTTAGGETPDDGGSGPTGSLAGGSATGYYPKVKVETSKNADGTMGKGYASAKEGTADAYSQST